MNDRTILGILITVFYILGLCTYLNGNVALLSFVVAICLGSALLVGKIQTKRALCLFFFFIFGYFMMSTHTKENDPFKGVYLNDVRIEGRVHSIVQTTNEGKKQKFYLGVDKYSYKNKTFNINNSKILVTVNNFEKLPNEIQIGDKVLLEGKLRSPKGATNPSQFDYAKYLKYKDVFCVLYVEKENANILSKADNFATLSEFWWFVLQKLDNTRNEILSKHSKYIKSPNLEILGGIVFGSEAINPPDEVKQSFVNSGLLHLLAASGLNVALIFGIWWFIASRLSLPYPISVGLGMFFVILYTFMTGFPPSILRASIMILFVLFGKLIDRQANVLSLVFFVGLLMLLFDPKMFCDVGFQLSFVVTIGLISCVEPICEKFKNSDDKFKAKFKDKTSVFKMVAYLFLPSVIVGAILVPLVAQIFVAPLQMYYFNTFTPLSVFANLSVMPFIGVVSFFGFISSILSLIPILGEKIISIFDFLVEPLLVLMVKISKFFASFDISNISTPSPNFIQIALFWALAVLLVQNIKHAFNHPKLRNGLLITILIFAFNFIRISPTNFEIIAFDVNNADSFLIKTPNGKHIMIDTGKMPYLGVSSAKMIMGEYLKDNNIRTLEKLIITHFDNDHSGGTVDIIKDFKVDEIIVQNTNSTNFTRYTIFEAIKNNKIKTKVAKNNEIIYKEDGFSVKTFSANTGKDNEDSIVTLIENDGVKYLFMGDCGIKGYSELKNYLDEVDVIKVGHHGAKNSLDKNMLDKLNPKIAIISTGFNTYGHPNDKILELLADKGIKTYLTKDFGAIKLTQKGSNLKVLNYSAKFWGSFKEIPSNQLPPNFIQSEFATELTKRGANFLH